MEMQERAKAEDDLHASELEILKNEIDRLNQALKFKTDES